MTECNQSSFGFEACGRREIVVRFDGGTISSDGGAFARFLLRKSRRRPQLISAPVVSPAMLGAVPEPTGVDVFGEARRWLDSAEDWPLLQWPSSHDGPACHRKVRTVRQADEAFDSLIDILTVTLASEVKKCGAATEASPARSDLIGRIALRVIERLKELITRRREGADSGRDDQGAVERSCGHGWPSMELILPDSYPEFLVDLKDRIRTAQLLALPSVNRELVLLYCKSSARFSTAEP